jgi:hypothetical protein
MRRGLAHPIWTHIPAVAALVTLIVYVAAAGKLPASAPIHFSANGTPNDYGSPWLAIGLAIGLSIFYLALSFFADDIWARQEKAKAFNWLSLLDELVVGSLVGITLGYVGFVKNSSSVFHFPWITLLVAAGSSLALGVFLEAVRPFRPQTAQIATEDVKDFKVELEKCIDLDRKAPFVYWEAQNPFYMNLLAVLLPLIMFISAAVTLFSQWWVSLVLIVVGMPFVMFYGGMRVVVSRDDLSVRYGIPGIRVLHLKMSDISQAEIMSFAPLKDFGGYGIRFNGKMWAYYLRGSRGVRITAKNGEVRLIGSDHPERLLATIQAVTSTR